MHGRFDTTAGGAMPAATPASCGVPDQIRSRGVLDLAFRRLQGRTALHRAFQSGCLRVRVPRAESGAEQPCAVVMNTAGGLADGDRLDERIVWGEGTAATVTTQAAEKVYRALGTGAVVSTRLEVERGACAEWLPQELILFDAARLRRDAQVLLAENVSFLGLEAVVLGRAAMGETVRSGALHDRLRIWRGGRLIYADALALEGDIAALMRRAALGDGARALAVIVHAADGAQALLEPLRDALSGARGLAAASCWNGLLAVRLLAPGGESLRHDIGLALAVLRGGRALPRVWSC